VHACDAVRAQGLTYRLPAGSRIMDTGGFKGQSRELAPDEFYGTLARTFGVAPAQCQNMYGMTELSTQFYDSGQGAQPVVKSGPHWIRTRVLDPLSGQERPHGEVGVLAHTLQRQIVLVLVAKESQGQVVECRVIDIGTGDETQQV